MAVDQTSTFETLRVRRADGIAVVTLTRAPKKNAIDHRMFSELLRTADTTEAMLAFVQKRDPDLRGE